MKITMKQLRKIIKEINSINEEIRSHYDDYMLWAEKTEHDSASTSVIAKYALEGGLEPTSPEVQEIVGRIFKDSAEPLAAIKAAMGKNT
jgi:hypothetical protein